LLLRLRVGNSALIFGGLPRLPIGPVRVADFFTLRGSNLAWAMAIRLTVAASLNLPCARFVRDLHPFRFSHSGLVFRASTLRVMKLSFGKGHHFAEQRRPA
jgi:hypothetical protein